MLYYIHLTFLYYIYISIYSHIYISSHRKHINDSPYDSSDHIFCWFMIEACTNQFSVSTPAAHLQPSTTFMTLLRQNHLSFKILERFRFPR